MNTTLPRTKIREEWTPTAWVGAILLFGVGDIVTTFLGVGMFGGSESNPLLASAFAEVGLWTLVPLKVAAFGLAGAGYHLGKPYTLPVPWVALFFGTVVVLWNSANLYLAWVLGGI